uniref:Uncharacterized protein n=1 Tax=Acrobeloides nanus TaxID=290746 RepID=A0A914CP24_9BILA
MLMPLEDYQRHKDFDEIREDNMESLQLLQKDEADLIRRLVCFNPDDRLSAIELYNKVNEIENTIKI